MHTNTALVYSKELEAIAVIESSSGTNLHHKRITSGIHKNSSAIGRYGLMPLTIRDFISKSKDKEIKKLKYLTHLTNLELSNKLVKSPALNFKLAMRIWKRLRDSGLRGPAAAYAWFWGRGRLVDKDRDEIENSGYVKKFKKALREILLKGR